VLPFAFAAEREIEPLRDKGGRIAALFLRTTAELHGQVTVAATDRPRSIPRDRPDREPNRTLGTRDIPSQAGSAQRLCLIACAARVRGGGFASLLDPLPELASAAAQCDNQGLWPVLVGEDGATDLMLSAPIILYDCPKVAPESLGDLFDGATRQSPPMTGGWPSDRPRSRRRG
jgi:hypothetical protein